MKPHYSEADLLETYYTQPGASMPVMMHLADCAECAARYERLERKIRGLATCAHEKPETFWARQRIAVMRKIDARRSFSAARVARVAAAAVLVLVLGGVLAVRLDDSSTAPVQETAALQITITPEDAAPRSIEESPWDSEELHDLRSMVAWESWVESGDQSL